MEQFINLLRQGAVIVVAPEKDRSGKMVPVPKLKVNGADVPTFEPSFFPQLKAKVRLTEQKIGQMSIYRV